MAAELGESFRVRKPYKISGKNKQFKGIVAHSWADFKSAACSSLQISTGHDAKVFLEEDLTEVDNEEYFQFLPAQTKFIILQPWETIGFGPTPYPMSPLERSESQIIRGHDVTDAAPQLDVRIKQRIISDPTFYVNLNDDQLESVIALDPDVAQRELAKTKEEIMLYQETCERELARRSELRDATELLRLYEKSRKVETNDDNGSSPKKLEQTHNS